jgi:hypothetical protein
MHATFFQKVLLAIFAGFVAACMIYGFNHIFEGANRAAGNYQQTSSGKVKQP